MSLFLFRYVRLIGNTYAYLRSRPVPLPPNPTYSKKDVTVVMPTADPTEQFAASLRSIATQGPGKILVVTVGAEKSKKARRIAEIVPGNIEVVDHGVMSKREQLCAGIRLVKTPLVFEADDSIFWPDGFIEHMIAPFEDHSVGCVGCTKQVRRLNLGWTAADVCNFIGANYLSRHNFQILATNYIDGGVFVVSGRCAAFRTNILADPSFMFRYLNEWFLGVGPLNVDEDNFITRWLVTNNWNIAIQSGPHATMETVIGDTGWNILFQKMFRWARTTFRSNAKSLVLERSCWRRHPWTVYAEFISSYFNAALFYDSAMLLSLWKATLNPKAMFVLALWVFASKMVKAIPHFRRHPKDLVYLPVYVLFGYVHSFIKLWAAFTVFDISWSSRPETTQTVPKSEKATN
ncbi:nucleotide-diphospho-sugar transferase [Lineolata rhizophorae]|uniref:Nucleotide-diphospho-sugar transferase n=1 Tax=Lineolata rhizophorae TaxID=578093 RepID=A0A6A6PE63_9PEZI|nr:nucleotide-diphospho-sugar transferase [Lineolata rhizophorae]